VATPSRADEPDDPVGQAPERDAADRPEVEPALTLRQILGGFALVAAVIVLLSRRRSRSRTGGE
jgi:hypothetical protein